MKLIDKATIVAEIERRIEKLIPMVGFETTANGVNIQLAREELQKVLCFLDTLEVIEVDLEKELSILDNTLFDLDGVAVKGATHYLTVEDVNSLNLDLKHRKENNHGKNRFRKTDL